MSLAIVTGSGGLVGAETVPLRLVQGPDVTAAFGDTRHIPAI